MPRVISNTIQLHVARFNRKNNGYDFLLLQRAPDSKIYPSTWQVVTGRIENNETAFQAALRELLEETGLIPMKKWTLPYVASFYIQTQDAVHMAPCFGVLVEENSIITLSDEHQAYEWMNCSDSMIKLVLPSHIEGTKIFLDHILKSVDENRFMIKD